jgi:Sulfotransferase domain
MDNASKHQPDWVTIVSGLPRSGTSMMMQLLEAGGLPVLTDQTRRPDEDNPKGYYELEAVKQVREDAAWLDDAQGKVVKMVYRLLYDLPPDRQYRVVFMKRDLEEVIASQDEMLNRLGTKSKDIDAGQLSEIYRRQLGEIEEWLEEQPNFHFVSVRYKDVLVNPERVVREINAFLDNTLDEAAMLEVPDPNLYRQRA